MGFLARAVSGPKKGEEKKKSARGLGGTQMVGKHSAVGYAKLGGLVSSTGLETTVPRRNCK